MDGKQRYGILALLLSGYLLCYLDRMVMASAIPFIAKDFDLSPLAVGEVLSAFFVGYALMQIPGGVLADRFGPKGVLTVCTLWWSVMTAFAGLATSLRSLLLIRFLFGVGEGPFPAAASKTVSLWFPPGEVGRASGFQFAATMVGAAAAPLFAVEVIEHWGWRAVFYSLFFPGILLTAILSKRLTNTPTGAGSSVSASEEQTVAHETGLKEAASGASMSAALLATLRSPVVLWCAVCFFLMNMVAWGLLNWLPTYLMQVRGFSAKDMGVSTGLSTLGGGLGYVLGGYLCDGYFLGRLRNVVALGLFGSAGATYLAVVSTTGAQAVGCVTLIFLFSNLGSTALLTAPLLVVPRPLVGTAFGLVNTAGQLAGAVAPVSVGYLLTLTHSNFEFVLYCMVSLALAALYPALRIQQPLSVRLSDGR